MIKVISRLILIFLIFNISSYGQSLKLDPKTSMAVPTYLGKVILLRGDATKINKKGNDSILRKNEKIYIGDTIKTENKTIIKIKMNMIDDSIFTIASNSVFEFNSSSFTKDKDRRTVYNFIKGKMKAHFPNKSKPGEIKINLGKNVSLGVRGTIVLSNLRKNQVDQDVLQVALLKGKINLKNKLSNKTNILNPKSHLIAIYGKEGNSEKLLTLNDQAIKNLMNKETDSFLKYYYTQKELSLKNGLKTKTNHRKKSKDQKNWKNSLKELNKRLNEYNNED